MYGDPLLGSSTVRIPLLYACSFMRLAVSHVHGLAGTRVRQGHVAFLVVGHHPLLGSGSILRPQLHIRSVVVGTIGYIQDLAAVQGGGHDIRAVGQVRTMLLGQSIQHIAIGLA